MKTKTLLSLSRRRDGISIIEVLTSLAVATIGVFGVLVLIPFAVKQAQIGLDQDAADLVGRNAIEDLQTYGFTSVSDTGQLALRGTKSIVTNRNDVENTPDDLSDDVLSLLPTVQAEFFGGEFANISPNFFPVPAPGLNAGNPRIIHFDPIAVGSVGFHAVGTAGANFNSAGSTLGTPSAGDNPDFLTAALPPTGLDPDVQWNDLRVTVATGTVIGGGLLDLAETNRIFRTQDDLVIGERNFLLPQTVNDAEAESELALPQPAFDVSTAGHLLKRQSNGRISWSAIFVPFKDNNRVKESVGAMPTVATKYKVYVLVYKDRSVIPGDPDSVMNAAVVNRRNSAQPPSSVANGGFSAAVDQIHLNSTSTGVFKDDWVMLINRKPAPEYGVAEIANLGFTIENNAEEAGYDVQLGFAKVLAVRADDVANTSTLTVDGGAFNFYFSDIEGEDYGFDRTGMPDADFTTETYAIHLQNVINVYERTITLERDSSWN